MRLRQRLPKLAGATLAVAMLSACSTSGRDLAETSMSVPPSVAVGSSSSAVLIEALGGFAITSPEFVIGGSLPSEIGRDTENRSPALQWTATPEDAAELALAVTDATGTNVYWLVTGMAATDLIVAADTGPLDGVMRPNSLGNPAWDGPVATGGASVTVVFRLYALDQPLTVTSGIDPTELVRNISAQSFASATLTATFLSTDQPQMS